MPLMDIVRWRKIALWLASNHRPGKLDMAGTLCGLGLWGSWWTRVGPMTFRRAGSRPGSGHGVVISEGLSYFSFENFEKRCHQIRREVATPGKSAEI